MLCVAKTLNQFCFACFDYHIEIWVDLKYMILFW